jgi:hypothetical protein
VEAGCGGSSSLDLRKHNRNKGCGVKCVAGPMRVNGKRGFGYTRLKCKAWDCPECGPRKAYQLRRAIQRWAVENNLTRFLTLTLDPKGLDGVEDKVRYIRGVWSKFRVYVKRELGKSLSFIEVLELQQSGVPHLHVLLNKYIPQKWISSRWAALGGGRIVFIKRIVELDRVASYLTKYLTKEVILSVPKGVRRYTTSRDIKLFASNNRLGDQYEFPFMPKRPSGWYLTERPIERLYKDAGLSVMSEQFDEDGSIRAFSSEVNLEK